MLITRGTYPHKWRATFDDGKTTQFGHADYQDYTQHHDANRRRLYRIRHKKDLETGNYKSPGHLSYYILWGNSTDLNTNIRNYKKKYNL